MLIDEIGERQNLGSPVVPDPSSVMDTDAAIETTSPLEVSPPVIDSENDGVPTIDETIESITELTVTNISESEPPKDKVSETQTAFCEMHFPISTDKKVDSNIVVELPSADDATINKITSALPDKAELNSPDIRKWAFTTLSSLNYTMYNNVLHKTVNAPDAGFTQKPSFNNLNMMAASPNYTNPSKLVEGDRAIMHAVNYIGLGTMFQVPLYHSGIWVTLIPPSDTEIVEFNRQFMSRKGTFGRNTYGFIYGNSTSLTLDLLMDFIEKHIYNSTVDLPATELRKYIKVQDIPVLVWGLACAQYPNGFQYERSCSAPPTLDDNGVMVNKCTHVVRETLNLPKLQWSSLKSLTEWQKAHMSSRQAKEKTLDSVLRYQDELAKSAIRKVDLASTSGKVVSLILKTPTIQDHISYGHQWVSDMTDNVINVIESDASPKERNDLIVQHALATSMMEYRHYVKSIEFNGNTVEDEETITTLLKLWSADAILRTNYINEVVRFIEESTISVIGIPAYDCPVCKGKQEDGEGIKVYPKLTSVIPVSVYQLFFALLSRRIELIAQR